jgi:hypothetical protein
MNALALIESAAPALLPEFQPHRLPVFASIPAYHHDVAVLHGMVVVYDTDTLAKEGVQEGSFYVKETQYPVAGMRWESWLRLECEDQHRDRRAQPRSPLKTRREVVQAVRLRGSWFLRLASGFNDGPVEEWSLGHDFVGKVVGVYDPSAADVDQED